MPANFDGVWEVRLFYDATVGTQVLTHRHTIDVNVISDIDPGEDFSAFTTEWHDSTTSDLETDLTTYLTLLKEVFDDTALSFTHAELWRIPEGTTEGTFYAILPIAEAGTHTGTVQIAAQATLMLRTQGGGLMRVQLMEHNLTGFGRDSVPISNTDVAAIATYLESVVHPFLGRDNRRPIAASAVQYRLNSKTFDQRYFS